MHLEEFAEGTTLLHRLDPRVKFVTAVPFIGLTAVEPGLAGPLFSLGVAVVLALWARLDVRKLLVRLLVVNTFVLMLWLFLPFSVPGREAFSLGPFTVTEEGIRSSLTITLKTNAVVLLTIGVFGTSEVFSLAHALVHLKMPRKLVHLFFFFYRYLSVLHEEYTKLRTAMKLRGFRPASGMHTYRTYAYLVGMLLVRSYERSERIYEAMLCRGFHGHFPVISHFHLHGEDMLFGGLMLFVLAGLIAV
jgi:cobalt/nickel transport system permease protein